MEIPLPTLKRLPVYYAIFSDAHAQGKTFISSQEISDILGIDKTQVRKDIALTGYVGKPKIGYDVKGFMEHLDRFLGFKQEKRAVMIGAGNLGGAIARYTGLQQYGFVLAGVFDSDPAKIGTLVGGLKVQPMDELEGTIRKEQATLAVLVVPGESAQAVAERVISAGIEGIWNFTPSQLKVPERVALWNQNLTASFLALSMMMRKEPVRVPYDKSEGARESLYLCMGSACHQRGSFFVLETLKGMLQQYDVSDKIELKGAFCLGHCSDGITMKFRDQILTGISKENIQERFLKEIFPFIG
ncbi:MAG TPA: redox-sensing transcriptional repressor Rex [Candidatus Omnitrophota bacterium]|jgi:redox-sensing transcriptional repressor|nr:redox-sensing transcriptional repressor Rex [Candidatus Omnitrophota bacterium]HSA30746.1 redox-sensing transcriptional repressor Rex [Candidatus Omnitrophota bacterium]